MDRETEQRVWQRVYGQYQVPPRLTPQQRQNLKRSLERASANLRFFESQCKDPVYREAFLHLSTQTNEHCKMLRQILGQTTPGHGK
jgi:hypothetical protein